MMNMQAGIPKAQLMAGDAMNRALTRMAHEMMEQLMPLENVVLVGIRRRGVPLAQRLSDIIEKYEHVRIPVGEVDIAMYRDDRDPAQLNVEVQEKHLPVDVTGKVVVLVDDVLHKLASVLCRYNAVCADNFRCFQTDFSRSLNNAESGSFSKLFQRFKLF